MPHLGALFAGWVHPSRCLAKGWDSIHYFLRASDLKTSVRARLERLARDKRSESRAAELCRKNRFEIFFLAPQARAQRCGAR